MAKSIKIASKVTIIFLFDIFCLLVEELHPEGSGRSLQSRLVEEQAWLYWVCCLLRVPCTLSHPKSFIESAVSPIGLFLLIIMMPLKRCVAKENYLIALLRNEARNNFLMSGPWLSIAKLRPLSFSAPRWRCCYLIFSSCNVKFPR